MSSLSVHQSTHIRPRSHFLEGSALQPASAVKSGRSAALDRITPNSQPSCPAAVRHRLDSLGLIASHLRGSLVHFTLPLPLRRPVADTLHLPTSFSHHHAPPASRVPLNPTPTNALHSAQSPKTDKMAPVHDAETQFKFLISCIKHSTAGKVRPTLHPLPIRDTTDSSSQVDFQAVATELEIVSKAAA